MALPMAHLLAAYDWARDREELLNCPEYYLGAIAPDAVHVRDGGDKSRKDDVHLNNWRRPNEEAVARFWRDHQTPFEIGYGIHVLLDGHWANSFRRDFPQILNENGRPIPELYYHDAFSVDREFYLTSELTPFFMDMLNRANAPKELIIPPDEKLTGKEFLQWRSDTIGYYIDPPMRAGTPKYITTEYTRLFIDRCGEIFTRVWTMRG